MNNQPIISVIIPVYNTSQHLENCIDSVLLQTYQNIEIILVDDGSTDGSGDICDAYAKKNSRLKVIHKENEGVSKARNYALRIAQGQYIGFVDSDDTIDVDMFELLYQNLVENRADVSICNLSRIIDGKVVPWSNLKDRVVYNSRDALKEVLLDRAFFGSPCNKLFNRSVVQNLSFPEDIHFAEDTVFVVRAFLNSERIVFDPVSKYNYFERANSAVTNKFNEKTFTWHVAMERILDLLFETKDDELIEYAYTAMLVCDVNLLGRLYYNKDMRKQYCSILQKNIRQEITFSRLKRAKLFHQIGIIFACLNLNLFYFLFKVKEKVQGRL